MSKKRFTKKIQDQLFRQIDSMTDEELHNVIVECNDLTTYNCGWLEYELRNIISGLAKNKLDIRPYE